MRLELSKLSVNPILLKEGQNCDSNGDGYIDDQEGNKIYRNLREKLTQHTNFQPKFPILTAIADELYSKFGKFGNYSKQKNIYDYKQAISVFCNMPETQDMLFNKMKKISDECKAKMDNAEKHAESRNNTWGAIM